MTMNNGWIKLHRKFLDSSLIGNANYIATFTVLLLLASHSDTEFIHGNVLIKLKRGQLVTGRKKLSSLTGIKEGTIQSILKTLETIHVIQQQTNNRYRVITIINYDKYQDGQQQTDNKITTTQQQNNTFKNVKNVKKEKNNNLKVSSRRTSPYNEQVYKDFIDWFNEFTKSKYGYTDKKAKRQLKYLLENGATIEDVRKAVSGADNDKFLTGDNDKGKKYLTPEFITRTDKYEKYREVYSRAFE